jgi:hypothetical protein
MWTEEDREVEKLQREWERECADANLSADESDEDIVMREANKDDK